VYNLTTKTDVQNQKRKLKEHKALKAKLGVPKKRRVEPPETERLNKQRYIIEEFRRMRTRMSKRETLTFDRLKGILTAEACQQRGHQIEEEDFKAAQKERVVVLKRDKTSEIMQANFEYRPSVAAMNGAAVEFVAPEPIQKDLAEKLVLMTKEGAMADLPTWTNLTKDQQECSKRASGWTFMDFFERARQEAFGGLG